MLFRTFGRSGIKVSALSFGSMRWPSERAAFEIVGRGLDAGMNYVDTSTGYCAGKSLKWTGRAVKARRSEILFSCKSDWAAAKKADDVRRTIEASLKEAELDYFDFWQIWGLGKAKTVREAAAKGGFFEGVRQAVKDGLVKHGTGFTFHGPADAFRAAVDTGEFICATVSYNLLNRADDENITYAASKGVGMIAMNPVAGGVLGLAGDAKLDFLRGDQVGPAYGALRFLLADAWLSSSIIGFRKASEVDDAVAALAGAEKLGDAYRRDLIEKMDAVKLLEGTFCTGCEYCKECGHGMKPHKLMQVMRDFARYGVPDEKLADWIWSKYPHEDAMAQLRSCRECDECETKCPQKLPIRASIRRVKKAMGV